MSDAEALLRWYIALSAVSLGLLPLVAWLGRGLGSFAYGLTRPLGVVALTWLVWWPAALVGLPFRGATLIGALAAGSLTAWLLWWRRGRTTLPIRWQALLAFELAWLACFLGYAWFRGFNPDIAYTEKPMEIALLSSVSRSSEVPAPDAWLAGYTINYYYFGYQTMASLVRLSGVPTGIAFNLALATIVASSATAAAATAGVLARMLELRRWLAVLAIVLAPVLLLLAGNLETTKRLLADPRATIDAGWWDGVGWQASRIIVDHDVAQPGDTSETINEFPAFSFVLGDLHPHVLAYPLLASVVALAVGLATESEGRTRLRLGVLGGLVGLLYATNSWDAPAGLLVVLVMLAIARGSAWRALAIDALAVVGGAVVAALPFLLQFDAPVGVPNADLPGWLRNAPVLGRAFSTFGVVTWRPSSAGELLTVHGAWLATFVAFAALELRRQPAPLHWLARNRHAALVVGLLSVGISIAWLPALLLIGLPLVVATVVAARGERPGARLLAALYACGFFLVLVPEFVYLQDVFADRMNTVFKLYFQGWLLLSVASAAALAAIVAGTSRQWRPLLTGALVVGVAATLTYTPLSASDWTNGFAERRGLDGAGYLARASPGDAAAIAWIDAAAEEGDTIVEAPGCSYAVSGGVPLNRVSAFTGLPTIVGWTGHESQWRRGQLVDLDALLRARVAEANGLLDGQPSRLAPRFLVLGRQELNGSADCDNVAPRVEEVREALAAAGWIRVFEAGSTAVFVRGDDPLADERR